MINECEGAMICDLAETYGILDYKQLKPDLIATLVVGLKPDSRVMLHLSGNKATYIDSLLALIFDLLQIIAFKQGHKKGAKHPESLYKKLTEEKAEKDELMAFETPEEFEKWRKEHVNG